MSGENNNEYDRTKKYFKYELIKMGTFVTSKMAKQISYIAKRRKQSISHFILDAVKYYIKHECSVDWEYSKMYIREEQIKKGN